MRKRAWALAIMVAVAALPVHSTPTYADSCVLWGSAGVFMLEDGVEENRGWKLFVDGILYESDALDKFYEELNSQSNKDSKTRLRTSDLVQKFEDRSSITRYNGADTGRTVDVVLKGKIKLKNRSGWVSITDDNSKKDYRIDDPADGPRIRC